MFGLEPRWLNFRGQHFFLWQYRKVLQVSAGLGSFRQPEAHAHSPV